MERGEIYDLVRDSKITGFAIVSGDRHSFWAGYATSQLPPGKFEPVGLSFVGGSLSSAGAMEALEHRPPDKFPLRQLYLADRPGAAKPDWTYNMLLKHGVRSCLEYAKSFDLERARAVSNPELSPHLEFVDTGGHGYATVRLTGDEMRTEFVCIPRPITRSDEPRRRAAALSRGPHREAVGAGRAAAARAAGARRRLRACPSRAEADVNGGWYWQALSRRDGARLRPADRHRARLEASRTRSRARASPACAPSLCSASAAGSPGLLGALGQPFVAAAIVAVARRC